MDWSGWGPRLSLTTASPAHTLHAGGAITPFFPTCGSRIMSPGAFPSSFNRCLPLFPASPEFSDSVLPLTLPPRLYHPRQLLFASEAAATFHPTFHGRAAVPERFGRLYPRQSGFNYSRLSASIRISARIYRHEHLGVDHEIGSVKLSASYVGTAGIHLASILSPNSTERGEPAFAPYTQFNAVAMPSVASAPKRS